MNVLYFTQLFYPNVFGGGEYLFYLISRALVERGHKVHVVTQRLHGTKPVEVFDGINIHRVGSEIRFSGTLPPTIRHNLRFLINAVQKGREIIKADKTKKGNIDIIHSNPFVPVLAGHLCSLLYNIPHIVSLHDVYQANNTKFWNDWMSREIENAPFYAPTVAKLIEKIILRLNVSVFHTVSEMSRQDLISFGVKANKIRVISPGLDALQLQEGKYENMNSKELLLGPTAVFIGRLIAYKNIQTVIQAFDKVVRVIPNARLIIIGEGPYKHELVNVAKTIKDNITFTGKIAHNEKLEIIRRSSFMVFPSLVEGFGIAIIEGFACSKPVLVSNVRPSSDVVRGGYTGFVISPFDIDEWADKMIQLFNNKDQQEEMGKNAYQDFISNYELKNIVTKMERLYEEIAIPRG
jgi:glycosyltransferase involved in cell wall biosynthesis